MESLSVNLGDRSYPIYVGDGLLSKAGEFLQQAGLRGKVAIVTSPTVAQLYLDTVQEALDRSGFEVVPVLVPDGEEHKNWSTLNTIFDALLAQGCGRDCTLVALGGGVIGDLTGFAAATYQRGVQHIQVPTTLLAQVDSSVGGKTAINHPLGKNMIGAFHQPRLVLADMDALKSNVFGNGNARAANTLRSKFLQGTPDWMPDGLAGTSEHNNVVWMSHEDAERVIKYVAMSNMHLGTFAVRKQETSGPGRPKIIADPIDDSTLRDRWMFKRTDAERPQVVRPDQVLRVSQWLPAADSRTARDFSASLYLYSSVPEYRGIDQATIADAYEKYSSRSQLQAVPVAPVRLPTQETVFPVPATYARTGQGALLLPAQGQGGLVSMDTTPAPAPDSPPIPSSSPVPGSPAGNLSGDM